MLKIDRELIDHALKSKKLIEHKEEQHYFRFREDFHHISRGTVLLKDRILPGFPHIPRIFRVKEGIEKNITMPFYVEEKIDGFNLRIAKIDGNIYAFSRGGFLDPFATEKVRIPEIQKFFTRFPLRVLHAEMLGNTPYTHGEPGADAYFFVFDIADEQGNYLSCEEKYRLLKKFSLPSVPVLGECTCAGDAERIAKNLLKAKKEGMVIKSANRQKILKFVTPYADIEDIHRSIAMLFDMPPGFFLQRVLRSAIFMKDFDLPQLDYSKKLGLAFYQGLREGLKQLEQENEISEEFELWVRSRATWEKILRHVSKEVKIKILFQREEDGGLHIHFKKIYKKSSQRLRALWKGKAMVD